MNAHIKALLTFSVLAVLMILGITWGWSSMTSHGAAETSGPRSSASAFTASCAHTP